MKKKGFTLIELLAVIVILAIIAIISVPIITDLINKSRYGAFGVTKKNIERAAELYHAKNADDLVWEGNLSYVTIGTLKTKKFLKNNLVNTLDSTSINDDTKVLLYRKGRKVDYSLQLYDREFFDWYQGEMIKASKREDITLPTTVGDKVTIDLETLMGKGLVDELRLPLEPENRCVGYVEIEKTTDNYEYNAYVDCLQGASTFASHYVSYGGKYLDNFRDVKQTNDGGYIAVGDSNSEVITKYGNISKGKYDAIIVKFKSDGTVEWSHNYGGSNNDIFYSVIETTDGYVAVGNTTSDDLDVEGLFKGGNNDAILVKYNKQGEVIYKKNYGTSSGAGTDSFIHIIKVADGYVITGTVGIAAKDGDLTGITKTGNRSSGVIIKYDNNFNMIWQNFFSGSYYETLSEIKTTTDGGYIVVGSSSSYDLDMTGLAYDNVYVDTEALILKYDGDGNLQYKNSFFGSEHDRFQSVIEVTDGYITVGSSNSNNVDMEGLNKTDDGDYDAIIVKYDKTLTNVLWKKSFGGSAHDYFNSIVKTLNNQFIVVGYSRSKDFDLKGNPSILNGYSNAMVVKYDIEGNVIDSKTFGGTNTDMYHSTIRTSDNNYVVAGVTYSNDVNLKNFNKGNSDAILTVYDSNLNLMKTFQEPVILIDKLKTMVPNYGTDISLKYDDLYTTNNPEIDLKGWCSTYSNYADNINYNYGPCLKPFNAEDIVALTVGDNTRNYKHIYEGEYEYKIENQASNNYNWHHIFVYLTGGGGANNELSNLKLKFADGYIGSIKSSIAAGYIEPLVTVSNHLSHASTLFFPNTIDIINTGGKTGVASYPTLDIKVKPKKSRLVSVIMTSAKNIVDSIDGLVVEEYRNFDMSITKAE